MSTLALLVCIVALAFAVEGALGFGSTVVTVTLGAFLVPIDMLLPAYVPANIVLSVSIVARTYRDVDARMLFRRVVPLMVLGMPFGMLALRVLDGAVLVRVYGVMIVVLAIIELAARLPSPSRALGNALLFAAGTVQGAFGTGGPLTVFVLGKELTERPDAAAGKRAFRATLCLLWLILNVVLVIGFAIDGRLTAESGRTTLWLVVGLAFGIVVGELVHRRLAPERFRVVVWGMLALAGTALALR